MSQLEGMTFLRMYFVYKQNIFMKKKENVPSK